MTPELYKKITELYHSALEVEPEKLDEYLERASDGDEELQREVLKLLKARQQAGDFLEAPAIAVAAKALAQEADPVIGKQLGRFRILSLLGVGGMGEVYLAQDLQLGRRVALKLLPTEFTAQADRLRRFEREARAVSSLNHPNIITIHDIGEVEGHHFIATEFIEGETLRQRIARGPVEIKEAIEITIQIANALGSAHAAGIVHRDIKPENLMLRPDGYVKVLDFGLAKLTQPQGPKSSAESGTMRLVVANETTAGTILGTVSYMSPEQARGVKVDGRSDLWSLGVTLYEMLAGKSPFVGQTMTDIIVSIVDHHPPPLSKLDPRLPVELDRIVMKALAKKCAERYQSATEMASDLKNLAQQIEKGNAHVEIYDSALESANTAIMPPSAPAQPDERIAPVREFKRRRLLIAVSALVVILLGLIAWLIFSPKPEAPTATTAPVMPEREISYQIIAQKMNDGEEVGGSYTALESETFADSDRFQFQFSSPQDGYLYLLNEDAESSGAERYSLAFPVPWLNNGSSQLTGNRPFQTGRYLFDPSKRTDTLILIWAARPIGELEAVKGVVNEKDLGAITDPDQIAAIRAFLSRHPQSTTQTVVDESSRQTTLRSQNETVIHILRLNHK